MWIVAIAWMYVTLMMALAEATNPQGSVLGAVFTFLLYGVGPLALVLYLLGAPARRKAQLKAEKQAWLNQLELEAKAAESPERPSESGGVQADGSGLPSTAPVPPMREETPGR